METIKNYYDYLLHDFSDKRVLNWPLMGSPIYIIGILSLYLLLVYKIIPKYMENRKPYELKTVLYYYNIYQIIVCCIIVYGYLTPLNDITFRCVEVDYSANPKALRTLKFVYFAFLVKITELIETIFFALRKKQRQISHLHVYHHVSTACIGWVVTKYIGGGMVYFTPFINSVVHIVMYTYYLLSSFGPTWQKRLMPWKPKITMMQLIQFVTIIVYYLQTLAPSCKAPKGFLFIFYPNILLLTSMFLNFYKSNYLKNRKTK